MDDKNIVTFDSWLKHRFMDKDWIMVAQYEVMESSDLAVDFFMISVLAKTNTAKPLLASSRWLTHNDFGKTDVWEDDGGKVQVAEEIEETVWGYKDVVIEPFTFRREWLSRATSTFELIQNFILFYNLYFDDKENTYNALSKAGESIAVIKVSNKKQKQRIEIRNCFLKNYLACKNRILVRQHDHNTRSSKTIDELGIEPSHGHKLNGEDYALDLAVADDHITGKTGAVSNLNGKDLVLPLKKPKDLLGWPKENCEFIIGVDDQGESIKASCKVVDNPTRFLTPVYFKRDVLEKYHGAQSVYEVSESMVACGGHWLIPIDTNRADLVQVWLGDLQKLPYNEQLYWLSYNVLPEGGITKQRLVRDFDGAFAESEDIVYQFKKSLKNFQGVFKNRFGFKLFKPLHKADAHLEPSLRVPVNNESGEFEAQLRNLATLLPDSINIKSIRSATKKPEKYQITALENFLNHHSLNTDIIYHLHKIQDMRSSGAAHRKGKEYEKNVVKYGLDKTTNQKFVRQLFVDMTKVLDSLALDI